jgi:UDP-N-acetylmuramoylalanine--D-glutamate ligase
MTRVASDSEVAVLGLGKSGVAAARLLLADGKPVYVSDSGSSASVEDAARQLRDIGASVDTERHDLARIARASKVVVSPGIDPSAPSIKAAREAGRPLVSEIEIALGYLAGTKIIAVTGTNGKTTTTALIGHVLRALGENAVDAGNIGAPLSDFARHDARPDWIALEMSSFQLHDTPSLAPDVGVLTNLSPDHLDRYPSEKEYYADKALLFSTASSSSRWVLNGDDARVGEMAKSVSGKSYSFSISGTGDARYDEAARVLEMFGTPLMPRNDLHLLGNHNVANALAAALAVSVADDRFRSDDSRRAIASALGSFTALGHRLEVVAEADGVQWINDSKATNVSSARVAIEGMQRPTILLMGGRHKGESYESLTEPIQRTVKKLIAYGEAAPIIEKDLGTVVPFLRLGSDFDEVMRAAREASEPGDAVLMSPACSSYDMFRNYEERGARFRQLALAK